VFVKVSAKMSFIEVFDKASQTLTCSIPSGTWVLKVNTGHIDGTLTSPDKVLFRKLVLSKAG